MSEVWTIKRLLEWSTDFLKKSGSESPRLDSQLLIGHITGLDKVQLYVQFDRPLGTGELATYRTLVKRRGGGEPVAYILGFKEFYGRRFTVDGHVLVPRPETEHLVDAALAHLREKAPASPRIVDVGTGSGAIAISLACELEEAVVVGVDVSAEALEVASRNAELLGVRDRVKLARGDVLSPIKSEASVHAVVSNPPYLDDALMATLPRDVRDHEPHLALYGGPDGLDVLRRLTDGARRVLVDGGMLAVELAGESQSAALRVLWEQSDFEDIQSVADYAGIARVLTATRRART